MSGPVHIRAARAPSTDTQIDIQTAAIEVIPWSSVVRDARGSSGTERGPRYTVLNKLHRGGMGEILLAQLTTPGGFSRRVVLKGLLSRLTADDVSHALFMREAHLMARLDHPNTVRVFDLPLIDGRPYLAMEHIRGRNLHEVIEQTATRSPADKGLPARFALMVIAEALRGLHSAHRLRGDDGAELGLVHRDVSPGNVLLSFCGEVKVTDFGIAKLADSPRYTSPRSIRGKARYIAPEQVRGRPATVESDIYSAGVVLAEALMGEPLWERSSVAETLMAIVNDDRSEVLDRVLRGLPTVYGLRSTLRRALATDPADRPESALHFAEILEAIIDHEGPRPTSVDLGRYLRDLYRGSPDLPDDGFGHSGFDVALEVDPLDPKPGPAGPEAKNVAPPARSGAPGTAGPSFDDGDAPDPRPEVAPVPVTGPGWAMLVAGIFIGACLAIAGCLVALSANL